MTPVIVMLLAAIVGIGVIAVQIGKATVLRSDAQTAADAAALAAARNIRQQLTEQVAATGTSSLELISDARVQAAAGEYAEKNGARLTRPVERETADVRVWVETVRTQGQGAPEPERRATAKARARLELFPIFPSGGSGGGGGTGVGDVDPLPGGGDGRIPDGEWKDIEKELKHHPPQCSEHAEDNDVYILGKHLQKHGFQTLANAQLGSPPTHGKHSETGWHFQCADSGAIDLSFDYAGGQPMENKALDALVEPLHQLGFSTIWRAEGHTDHMHINGGGGASIGAGGTPGGAVGPLVDTYLDIRLIDWDAPAQSAYYPFGGLGAPGGNPFGPPDEGVANLACQMLHAYHVQGKARLALWEAMIVESGVHNLPDGDSSSVGVLQALDIHGSYETRMNPAWQIHKFLFDGFAISTGAIAWARSHPSKTGGQIAQDIQGSDYPYRYDQRESQAIEINEKFCGGEGL
jgi:hypothetical protein